jgi:hypothetical protein
MQVDKNMKQAKSGLNAKETRADAVERLGKVP